MQTYMERATQIAWDSQIVLQILLSRNNDDIAFVRLAPSSGEYIAREEFTARQLRSVGVIGLAGTRPRSAFKEELPPFVMGAIAQAFVEYVSHHAQSFAAHQEIAELERLFALPDTRPN